MEDDSGQCSVQLGLHLSAYPSILGTGCLICVPDLVGLPHGLSSVFVIDGQSDQSYLNLGRGLPNLRVGKKFPEILGLQ